MGTLPQTGAEYLSSLNDGRRVGLDGGVVESVAEHPAFTGVAGTIAGLYDALHGAGADTLLAPTEAGGRTHAAFTIARTRGDLRVQRDAMQAWQAQTHGWVGRTPDAVGAIWAAIGAHPAFFGDFATNAERWFARTQTSALHFAQALVHPPVDRALGPDAARDVFVHVERETDAGLVVRGAKVVSTGAVTAQRILVAHFGGDVTSRDLALAFVADPAAPGVTLHARPSYAAEAGRSAPEDRPLAARFDENDAICVFDDVLVPWDDVLIHDVETMRAFNAGGIAWAPRLAFQSATRLTAKLEHIVGMVANAVEITGAADFRGVQAAMGELIAFRHEVAGLRDAMIEQAVPRDGAWCPSPEAALAFAALAPDRYSRMRVTIQQIVASGLAHVPSTIADLAGPLGRQLEPTLRGSAGASAHDRVAAMKLLWDAVGTEFGARQELFERSHWGQPEKTHLGLLHLAEDTGQLAAWRAAARP